MLQWDTKYLLFLLLLPCWWLLEEAKVNKKHLVVIILLSAEGIGCNCAPGVPPHVGLDVLLFQPPAAKGQVGKVRTLVAR